MIYQFFTYNSFVFAFAFLLTLALSYLEGIVFKIRKPTWAHLKNSLTTALITLLCLYMYKINESSMEIFTGEMKV